MNKFFKTLAVTMLLGSTAIVPAAFTQYATINPSTPTASSSTTTTGTMGTTGTATYLAAQAENQMRVSDFMGQTIYTADNQSIGEIKDLLVRQDGGIVAAVVGVGGFLGIGEKNVAVPFANITISREPGDDGVEGDARLTTSETADSLRNAPEFRTLDDQAADASTMGTAPATTPTDGTTTSSTGN